MIYLTYALILICSYLIKEAKPSYCTTANSCAECMKRDYKCIWCRKSSFDRNRCEYNSSSFRNACGEENVVYLDSIKKNLIIENARGGYSFTDHFKKNYTRKSAQIFFLVDHSFSMKNHIQIIKENFFKISKELEEKSSIQFQFAYGSFIEKPQAPFSQETKKTNDRPRSIYLNCEKDEKDCVPVYNFHLNTKFINASSANKEEIGKIIDTRGFGGNYDMPEATLDALFQVVVCDEKVGWEKSASHTILVFTDNVFHLAGDALVVNLREPPLDECNLNKTNYYDASTSYDYPSVGHLNYYLKQRKMSTYFMVSESTTKYYEALTEVLYQSSVKSLSLVQNDVSKIIGLIEDDVKSQSINVIKRIIKTPESSNVIVKPVVRCNKGVKSDINGTIRCPLKSLLEVTMSLNVIYADNKDVNITIYSDIKNVAYQFQAANKCPCNQSTDVCKHQIGPSCNESSCKDCPNSMQCICGKCQCRHSLYGDYCNCTDKDCPMINGRYCGNTGLCHCGKCQCDNGWSGSDCQCTAQDNLCINQYNEICTFSGECKCNECHCKHGYYGKFCEKCENCNLEECKNSEKCVYCIVQMGYDLALSEKQCTEECTKIREVGFFEYSQEVIDNPNVTYCHIQMSDQCEQEFYLKERRYVYLTRKVFCAHPSLIYFFICLVNFAFLAGIFSLLLSKSIFIIGYVLQYRRYLAKKKKIFFRGSDL